MGEDWGAECWRVTGWAEILCSFLERSLNFPRSEFKKLP